MCQAGGCSDARKSNGYVTVDVTVDIADVIEDISDFDLLEECRSRKLSVGDVGEAVDMDIVKEAYSALLRGHPAEAKSILDRIVFPKWRNTEAAQLQLKGQLNGN